MCSNSVAKTTLIILNIIFLVFGGVCLGVGIWVKIDQTSMMELTRAASNDSSVDISALIESAAYLLIGAGGTIFLIAFFGFCGAIKKIKFFLYVYALFVLLILLLEVTAAVLAVVFKTTFDQYAKIYLKQALTSKYVGPYSTTNSISLAFDVAQVNLKCCGVHNSSDYSSFSSWNTTWTQPSTNTQGTAQIPFTCCITSAPTTYPTDIPAFINGMTDDNCPVSQASAHTDGCYDALWSFLQTYLYVTLGVGLGVGALELLGVISACYLACTSNSNKIQNLS